MLQRRLLSLLPSLLFAGLVSCARDDSTGREEAEGSVRYLDGTVKISAVRVAATAGASAESIAPYDEALVWHEYEVKEVLEGELHHDQQRIRVAHWAVVRGNTVPQNETINQMVELTIKPFDPKTTLLQDVMIVDDLDVVAEEPPKYMDVRVISAEFETPKALRYDYGGFVSSQMLLYWKLRAQLELVVLGNSHASRAILTKDLMDEDNLRFPKALNLGTGGADGHLQCFMAERYVQPLPKLKTVIWMVSPRTFNKAYSKNHRLEIFQNSPGSEYDREHAQELWPVSTEVPRVDVAELDALRLKGVDAWGWTGNNKLRKLRGTRMKQLEVLKESMSKLSFDFDEALWDQFVKRLSEFNQRGVKVFLVISPIHPVSRDTPAADPDGSSSKDFNHLVALLENLDRKQPLIWFHDTNRNGHHHFKDSEFYDADHLNKVGAEKFTEWIKQWMQQVNLNLSQKSPMR